MQAGEPERAGGLVEALIAEDPEAPTGYLLLLRTVRDHETKRAEVLERWAVATPGDPQLVGAWMSSRLSEQEPEATRQVLARFFGRRPGGEADLEACLSVLRRAGDEYAAPATACAARSAADPDLPPYLARRATTALVERAAADGDWGAMTSALEEVDPEARVRALAAAAASLETPARCDEVIALSTQAAGAFPGAANDPYDSVARGLRGCLARPAAQALALDLLRRARGFSIRAIFTAFGVQGRNGDYHGELPPGTVALLEERLTAEPGEAGLYQALDVAYQLDDPEDRRVDLLRRWHKEAPESFRSEQAIDLAGELTWRGEAAAAVELLEGRLESGFDSRLAEALWELYMATAGADRAARYAAGVAASEEPGHAAVGHALAARSALLAGDADAARDHYRRALAGEHPNADVAVELLLADDGSGGSFEDAAARLCDETALGEVYDAPPGCVAELVQRARRAGAEVAQLPGDDAPLPDAPRELADLARRAQSAGRLELAERALRRLVEVDPRGTNGWGGLAVLFEEQGRVDDLEALLDLARGQFPSPPTHLFRALGRALTAAGQGERAVAVLEEARDALPPPPEGDYGRQWIGHELRQAYALLGRGEVQAKRSAEVKASTGPAAAVELPADATAEELRLAADALHSGAGGRYDPQTAADLYRRAAALGDPLSTLRLALTHHFGRDAPAAGEPTAEELHRRSVRQVEALAETGHGQALYLLGTAVASGLGGTADPARGVRLLRAAAEKGEPWAWHNLGWAAQTGNWGVAQDRAAAIDAFRRGSELGNAESMINLATMTLSDHARGEVCTTGLGWLRRSAGTGNAMAAAFLGKLLFYGRGECVAREPAESLRWLEAGAEARRPGATYDLALALLLAGDGAGDTARGLALMRRALEEPESRAAEVLALLHAIGLGVERDAARAEHYLAEAARLGSDGFPGLAADRGSPVVAELLARVRQRLAALAGEGDAAAAALLARGLETGRLGHDTERMLELARQGAAGGEALAMRVLSDAYRHGLGVEPDAAEALRWRHRCAHSGDSFCMMFLGQDLLAGETQSRDVEAGLGWLRRAAEAGNWWAVGDLARLYSEGAPGVPVDRDEAAVWMRHHADLGDADATGWLTRWGY
ncbi:MAG TPA: tetratricopeptide repeat protein [Thermoanaerobaculia bacterium]|nr:tetratricopeptide repeat protein [Thermoanaerobaculia bacterium]